jgi:hypothetical protein
MSIDSFSSTGINGSTLLPLGCLLGVMVVLLPTCGEVVSSVVENGSGVFHPTSSFVMLIHLWNSSVISHLRLLYVRQTYRNEEQTKNSNFSPKSKNKIG